MKGRNVGLIIFGVILLTIGLVLSLYNYRQVEYTQSYLVYPYQIIGMILAVAGIILSALGFIFSPRKTNDLPPPPPK